MHVRLGKARLVLRASTLCLATTNNLCQLSKRWRRSKKIDTCILSGTHTPRVIDPEIPLVESGDGKRRLSLLLRQTRIFEISNSPAGEFEQPSYRIN